MTSQQELEIALGASIDCLRMAAQVLSFDRPAVADLMRQQADTNMMLMLPLVRR